MKFVYKSTYLRAFDALTRNEQELAIKTDALIKDYLATSQAPFGLRIKCLRADIFEARLNDRMRVVWVRGKDEVVFALLGNHEDVRRFLKRL
jgi:hypothetical protein